MANAETELDSMLFSKSDIPFSNTPSQPDGKDFSLPSHLKGIELPQAIGCKSSFKRRN